ncbi:hypothetical protein Amet_0881 [Alkaliphilus metalliredigens QYMF]|uniref:Uncharacterized protein n=1 Tax=Alkaliphilus metalliredigens (strain QYMF) TaxID=293826 RepID=A6TLN5_ALKMQ|nr:hypothetical protein [Alkaliphilus metalliredigens]ABR47103.1 hypothetical protein Amet_0881 [Alkaliphilus metalliredigens QYMF]
MFKLFLIISSIYLFAQTTMFLFSPKIFYKFTDFFSDTIKLNLRYNKFSHLLVAYITSVYAFIKGIQMDKNQDLDLFSFFLLVVLLVISIPINIGLTKIKNMHLRHGITIFLGIFLAAIIFWGALFSSL